MALNFTPQQLATLHILLQLPPEQQQMALRAGTQQLPRSLSMSSSSSVESTPSTQSGVTRPQRETGSKSSYSPLRASDTDSESCHSSASSRIHHKTSPKKLATFLCKNYFASSSMWQKIYTKKNRISNQRLGHIIDKIKKSLSRSHLDSLQNHWPQVVRDLKKKLTPPEGTGWQSKTKKNKNSWRRRWHIRWI